VFGLLLFTFRTLLHTFNFRGSSRHSAIHSLTALSCAKVSPRSATSDEHGSDEPAIEETPEDLPITHSPTQPVSALRETAHLYSP